MAAPTGAPPLDEPYANENDVDTALFGWPESSENPEPDEDTADTAPSLRT